MMCFTVTLSGSLEMNELRQRAVTTVGAATKTGAPNNFVVFAEILLTSHAGLARSKS